MNAIWSNSLDLCNKLSNLFSDQEPPKKNLELIDKIPSNLVSEKNLENHQIEVVNPKNVSQNSMEIDKLNSIITKLSFIIADEFVSKLTELVRGNSLDKAQQVLKEAMAKTELSHLVLIDKFLEEPDFINPANRNNRGDWFRLLAKDPDFAQDAKTLLTYAMKEYNLAVHGKSFFISPSNISKKLVACYIDFSIAAIADGSLDDAKAALALAKECQNNLLKA